MFWIPLNFPSQELTGRQAIYASNLYFHFIPYVFWKQHCSKMCSTSVQTPFLQLYFYLYYKLERFCKDSSYILKIGNFTLYPSFSSSPSPHPCLNLLLLIVSPVPFYHICLTISTYYSILLGLQNYSFQCSFYMYLHFVYRLSLATGFRTHITTSHAQTLLPIGFCLSTFISPIFQLLPHLNASLLPLTHF